MKQKITLYILLLVPMLCLMAQVEDEATYEDYNSFSSRNFMKFNSFLTVPTFSVLHRDNQTIEAISRSSNIEFDDASRLHLLSYSGRMRRGTGAGIAVFQQEIGVFKDFGAIANYAHQLKLGEKTKLAIGFNFFYSRRSLDNSAVLTQETDVVVSNFQDIPIVNIQPAVTFSYGKFNVGVFLEDIAAFNLKASELSTNTEKTISGHVGYSNEFKNLSGLLKNSYVRVLGIARTSDVAGFTYAGNVMVDLPKAGWLKIGYDNLYGLNAGFGVNLSKKLSIGFAYEKKENLGGTNEIGLLYTLGRSRRTRTRDYDILLPDPELNSTGVIVTEEKIKHDEAEYEDPEHDDLSDELERAQDSINVINKKLNEILSRLKGESVPITKSTTIIKEPRVEVEPTEEPRDTTLPRDYEKKEWRKKEVITGNGGGGGTMYYVAVDQFQDIKKAKALVETYKRRKIKVKYVREPKTNAYFVYVNRHAKKEDAEKEKEEVNIGGGHEKGDVSNDDLNIKVTKSVYKDPVYVVKITLGAAGERYKVAKPQPRARVYPMKLLPGLEPGYYLRVNIFSKKAYADRFLDELQADGINADYFIDPITGHRHVYILKTDDRAEAIRLYNNNLNGSYYDRKSIINII